MTTPSDLSRRQFLHTTAAITGAAVLAPGLSFAEATQQSTQRTAVDQVTLGKTGVKLSRLGIGTGSANGHVQTEMGKANFIKLIRYAHDKGITYIDSAKNYAT